MAASFLDTNVLVYLAAADVDKADRAEQLLREGGVVSVQVMNELANVLRRKLHFPWAEAHEFLSLIGSLASVRPLTVQIHGRGLEIAERYTLSIYDAMIVASALEAGCETLWSEDMHDGLTIDGGVLVVNPFRPKG